MKHLQWKVHAAGLLSEIAQNSGQSILVKPLQIFGQILHEVGVRASELNDPVLNSLMCRLAIYEISDPKSPNYDAAMTKKIIEQSE